MAFYLVSVEILKRNVALETVQNRAARALGNLAMDPESSVLIHSAGKCVISVTVQHLKSPAGGVLAEG